MSNKFSNEEVARLLRQVSASLSIKNENRFKIIAYDKASESIGSSNIEVMDLWRENRLSELAGIGKGIAGNLDELFKTGKVENFKEIFKGLPQGMFILLDVSGIGPKTAHSLAKTFKLNNAQTAVKDLLEAAKSGKIAKLEGFGEKSQEDIIGSLQSYKKGQNKKRRMPLPYARETAKEILEYLKQNRDVIEVHTLGSLRRRVSSIGDIDIAASTDSPQNVLDWFVKYPKKYKLIETGPTGASIVLATGQQIDLRVQSATSFGSMLQYFTGSKAHNIRLREYTLKKGMSLNEYGIKLTNPKTGPKLDVKKYNKQKKIYEFRTEKEFYGALGLPLIPAELREDRGEIEAALKNKLPNLVELPQIRGDIHVHSNYNLEPSHDLGASTLKEILDKAATMGYEYMGISDHNPSTSKHTEKQIMDIMKRRKSDYEHILSSNNITRVKLFVMLEVDIHPDGKLALPDSSFEYVDAVIVSVHSRFDMDKKSMTARIIKGLSHPRAKILAHPTGRLIGKRDGYDADWQEIFDFCKNNNKALEINSYPNRLDLADIMVKRAVENNNKLVIDTDSHHKDQMDLIEYGISVARRGWATKNDILNTLSYGEFRKWLLS